MKTCNFGNDTKARQRKNDPKSYRPISLLTIFSKIFERLLLPYLLSEVHEMIPSHQFGFRTNHSCSQQLHRIADDILDTFEEKAVCLGLFLDTEKAFDKVWHDGLYYKIKNRVSDTYFRIIQSYLSHRTFSVKYESAQSRSYLIHSGVPQGSVLGPLLYILFTSDFPIQNNLTIAHFADDIAVLCKGSCDSTAQQLNLFCETINTWCKHWRIIMNPLKSQIVKFTYKKNIINHPVYLNGIAIPATQSVK